MSDTTTEPHVSFTDAAAEKLSDIIGNHANPVAGLRLQRVRQARRALPTWRADRFAGAASFGPDGGGPARPGCSPARAATAAVRRRPRPRAPARRLRQGRDCGRRQLLRHRRLPDRHRQRARRGGQQSQGQLQERQRQGHVHADGEPERLCPLRLLPRAPRAGCGRSPRPCSVGTRCALPRRDLRPSGSLAGQRGGERRPRRSEIPDAEGSLDGGHRPPKLLAQLEPRLGERIDVHAIDAVGARLYRSRSSRGE